MNALWQSVRRKPTLERHVKPEGEELDWSWEEGIQESSTSKPYYQQYARLLCAEKRGKEQENQEKRAPSKPTLRRGIDEARRLCSG